MKKRVIALVLLLCLPLTACGGEELRIGDPEQEVPAV